MSFFFDDWIIVFLLIVHSGIVAKRRRAESIMINE